MPVLPEDSIPQRIDADVLIPGKGAAIKNGSVVFDRKSILYAGDALSIPKDYESVHPVRVPVVMPGLWDCHIHFFGKTAREHPAHVPQALSGARCVSDVRKTLLSGVTSARELGGYGCSLAVAIAEERILGPTIYSAHSPISMTAGHGDLHDINLECFKSACSHGLPFNVADGIDECLKAVRFQLRSGAKVIKICASGGVASLLDDPHHQEFSDAELKAMVDEATRAHRVVAAHCHGKVGIMAALRAGCKSIEHGSYLDEEAIDIMVKNDVMLVATRSIVEIGLQNPQMFPAPSSYEKLVNLAADHMNAYRLAIKKGVKIALGTDLYTSAKSGSMTYGSSGRELIYAVAAGMTPLEAIQAATANGPLTVGDQAPLSGQLKEGYDSDIIVLSSNPLEDMQVFGDPKHVTHVWQGGKLVKAPGFILEL